MGQSKIQFHSNLSENSIDFDESLNEMIYEKNIQIFFLSVFERLAAWMLTIYLHLEKIILWTKMYDFIVIICHPNRYVGFHVIFGSAKIRASMQKGRPEIFTANKILLISKYLICDLSNWNVSTYWLSCTVSEKNLIIMKTQIKILFYFILHFNGFFSPPHDDLFCYKHWLGYHISSFIFLTFKSFGRSLRVISWECNEQKTYTR